MALSTYTKQFTVAGGAVLTRRITDLPCPRRKFASNAVVAGSAPGHCLVLARNAKSAAACRASRPRRASYCYTFERNRADFDVSQIARAACD